MPKPADAPEPLTECANWISPTPRLTAAVKMKDQGEMTRRRQVQRDSKRNFLTKERSRAVSKMGKARKARGLESLMVSLRAATLGSDVCAPATDVRHL